MELTYQKIVSPDKIIDHSLSWNKNSPVRHKRYVVGSMFTWLFGSSDDSSETTRQLKKNNLQQDQIKQLLKMNQLTMVETPRDRKLLKDLMRNMIQLNFMVN